MFRPKSLQLEVPSLIESPVPLSETADLNIQKRKVWKISHKKAPRVDELFNTRDEGMFNNDLRFEIVLYVGICIIFKFI